MLPYLDLVKTVRDYGHEKGDRTGIGTRALFGTQMRFDLEHSFPLLTAKKTRLDLIQTELFWFLQGGTNTEYLHEHGCHIWDEWADKNGDLGPIYGSRWRSWGTPEYIIPPKPKLRKEVPITYLNVANGKGKTGHPLGKTWEGMIARCYSKTSPSYLLYGGKGVFVSDAWLEFAQFAEDAEKIPNWELKRDNPTSFEYQLDKDIIGNGFRYSVDTCMWVSAKDNIRPTHEHVVLKGTKKYTFTSVTDFCDEYGCEAKNFSDLWTDKKNAKVRNGFTLVSRKPLNPTIDQIANVIEEIKTNPTSRRLIVSAWDPEWVEYTALPPCHMFFQFETHMRGDGKRMLSCQLYQRSADLFLGVPFNIASYALLTMMIAQVTGCVASEFIWTGGDTHIYNNHIDQVNTMLNREILPAPTMRLNPDIKNIDDFKHEDFVLEGYNHHPYIKADVAV